MINIKPTITVYDSDGDLTKAYNRAINKMIDKSYDIDLEKFDFDEVANGSCNEFDELVAKLCKENGLGSKDIYSILLERFEAEYDVDIEYPKYNLFEESKKSIKESNMILSFEAFKDICIEYIGSKMYIGSFDEYKGTYFISVIGDTRADKLCKYLRNNYDCECTFWKITDPYEDDYGFYRVEVI